MKSEAIQVFVSCESRQEAQKLADSMLNNQLIACAQIVNGVESFYRWQGQIERSSEVLLILKTVQANFEAVNNAIKALHSYETPEIIAVPIVDGSSDYLKWIDEQVK